MQMYASIRVLESQQKEINRSIGSIEENFERHLLDASRLEALEQSMEEMDDRRRGWTSWFLQTVGSIVITTLIVYLGGKLGISVSW